MDTKTPPAITTEGFSHQLFIFIGGYLKGIFMKSIFCYLYFFLILFIILIWF